jgi:hypothetical protein
MLWSIFILSIFIFIIRGIYIYIFGLLKIIIVILSVRLCWL